MPKQTPLTNARMSDRLAIALRARYCLCVCLNLRDTRKMRSRACTADDIAAHLTHQLTTAAAAHQTVINERQFEQSKLIENTEITEENE